MTLEIKKYPDPALKRKCEEVLEIDEEVKKLIIDMTFTLGKSGGAGLAAPQVGVQKRILIVQTELGPRPFINPKILARNKESEIREEGCLSFPGLWLKIKRPKEMEVEALNREGEKIRLKTGGLLARILQHEIDHLDGILFFERLNFWQRWKVKRKLDKMLQHFKA